MAREQEYKLIRSSEDALLDEKRDDAITFTIPRRARSIALMMTSLLVAALIVLVATITLLVEEKPDIVYSLPQLPVPVYTDCGGTPEEANRRNCTFDWMMHAWYTPECHHADLLQEAYEKKEWDWYLTEDASYKVPTSVIALGEHERAWTTEWFHREHCAYMWKKQIRYISDFTWMDDIAHEYEHTDHCSKFVLQPSVLKARNDTVLVPGYPSCISLRKEWAWDFTDPGLPKPKNGFDDV